MLDAVPVILELVVLVYCLIDCVQTPEEQVRSLPKVVWILLILILPIVGGIAWFIMGRPQGGAARKTWAPGAGFPEATRPRPLAPDDDPAFLRQVKQSTEEHEAMLKQWEADLRRREQEMRGDEPPGDSPKP
jgi:Phospholipase_D-nuclease N-terminal